MGLSVDSIFKNSQNNFSLEYGIASKNSVNAGNQNVSERSLSSTVRVAGGMSYVVKNFETRKFDAYLLNGYLNAIPDNEMQKTIRSYMSLYESDVLGKMDSYELTALFTEIQKSLQGAIDTEDVSGASERSIFSTVEDFLSKINSTNEYIKEMSYNISSEIDNAVSEMNRILERIEDLNDKYVKEYRVNGGVEIADIIDNEVAKLQSLTGFNFQSVIEDKGITLSLNDINLMYGNEIIRFDYDHESGKITIPFMDNKDVSDLLENRAKGKLAGLVAVRDTILKTFSAQMNSIGNYFMEVFSNKYAAINPGRYSDARSKQIFEDENSKLGIESLEGDKKITISILNDDNYHMVDSFDVDLSDFDENSTVADLIKRINDVTTGYLDDDGNFVPGVKVSDSGTEFLGPIVSLEDEPFLDGKGDFKGKVLKFNSNYGKIVFSGDLKINGERFENFMIQKPHNLIVIDENGNFEINEESRNDFVTRKFFKGKRNEDAYDIEVNTSLQEIINSLEAKIQIEEICVKTNKFGMNLAIRKSEMNLKEYIATIQEIDSTFISDQAEDATNAESFFNEKHEQYIAFRGCNLQDVMQRADLLSRMNEFANKIMKMSNELIRSILDAL